MLLGAGSFLFRYAIGRQQFKPPKPLSAVGLIEKTAEMGFDLVQFADNLPLDLLNDDELDKLKETALHRKVVLEMGTAGARTDRLLRYLEIAKRLDAKLVRMTPHAADTHPTYQETLHVLKEVLPDYRQAGVLLAVENHFTVPSPDLISLVSEIDDPYVGICLDTANSIVQQEWPMETVKSLGKYCVSLHLKDFKVKAHPAGIGVLIEGSPLGEGDQDIKKILDYMNHLDKKVNIILEQWMPPFDTIEDTLRNEEDWIRRSIKNMRKYMPQKK